MASKTFKTLLKEAERQGSFRSEYRNSMRWFQEKARSASTTRALMREQVFIGRLYAFRYEPKNKNKLNYYDSFPMVFPIEIKENGFLAINLHYLPLRLRAQLMNELWELANNQKLDETTRMRISYEVLKRAAQFKNFRPTVRYYLNKHVKSRFLNIATEDWNVAIFLPVEKFKKASKEKIWNDSRKKILGE